MLSSLNWLLKLNITVQLIILSRATFNMARPTPEPRGMNAGNSGQRKTIIFKKNCGSKVNKIDSFMPRLETLYSKHFHHWIITVIALSIGNYRKIFSRKTVFISNLLSRIKTVGHHTFHKLFAPCFGLSGPKRENQ